MPRIEGDFVHSAAAFAAPSVPPTKCFRHRPRGRPTRPAGAAPNYFQAEALVPVKLSSLEVVGHDIADAIVQECLFVERKLGTIRAMVTAFSAGQDVAAAMASAQVQEFELGELVRELEQLRAVASKNAKSWEEHSKIAQDLQHSNEDVWLVLDERYRGLEARVADIETRFASHADESDREWAVAKMYELVGMNSEAGFVSDSGFEAQMKELQHGVLGADCCASSSKFGDSRERRRVLESPICTERRAAEPHRHLDEGLQGLFQQLRGDFLSHVAPRRVRSN